MDDVGEVTASIDLAACGSGPKNRPHDAKRRTPTSQVSLFNKKSEGLLCDSCCIATKRVNPNGLTASTR
jgi:hypothetical protein